MRESFATLIEQKRDELNELELFTNLGRNALKNATNAVRQLELSREISKELGEPPPFQTDEQWENAKVRAQKIERYATMEKDRDFPHLYSLVVVRLWTILEALVDELVAEALVDPSEFGSHPLLSKLKGPLVEFRNASQEEQAEFLTNTLKQAVDASLKPGVGRFEAILEPVGLGGTLHESVRKLLFELSHVRNAVVHKGGKADRRLADACPWLGVEKGGPVFITDHAFKRYLLGGYSYLLELKGRTYERSNKDRPESLRRTQADVITAIDGLATSTPSDKTEQNL